jgi:response regulator RpfG family c-di-GMP phosphodiesterase
MAAPKSVAYAKLAERLLEAGKIDQGRYEAAITYLNQKGGRIEEALLEVNAISEAELLKFLAAHYKTRFVSTEKLAKADIDRVTLEKIPRKLAEAHQMFPVLYDPQAGVVSVVTPDPENVEGLREIQLACGLREVRAFVARPAAVRAALSKAYGGDIHAFAVLDRSAHEQFTSMLNVYERNLLSDEVLASALADANTRERTVSADSISKMSSGSASTATTGGVAAEAYLETLNVLVSLLENTRPDLRGHSGHVGRITKKLCERVGIAQVETTNVVAAAYLHDLGKMGAYHLTALNVAEYEGHRVAAEKSYQSPRRLMEGCSLTETTLNAIESMYERYDGKGLPGERSGKDIPLGGRIVAIADTYADLTQNPRNPFRKTLRPVEACEVLSKYKGSIFDPNLVDLFRLTVTGDDVKGRLLGDRHVCLLVDADPEETTVLELRLVQQGFTVRIARSTDQAMKALEAGDIEVVVSELELQPQDGFALLEEARKHAWGKELPWVLLTRKHGRGEAQRGFELGVLDVVAKPANTDLLVAKLKQMMEQRATKGGTRGVSGSLAEMGLADIVQILWHGRKTGSLKVRNGNDAGEIHFVDGAIYNALFGKLRGEEAFYAMLHMQNGDFALVPNFRAPARVIEQSPEALLLEAMRRMDEGDRAIG